MEFTMFTHMKNPGIDT